MSLLRVFATAAALTAFSGSSALAGGPAGKAGEPRPAMTDPDDAPLPAAAVARLGSTRLRNGGGVYDFAFSPDGKLLATAGAGNNMRLWDAATGRLVYEFPGKQGRAHQLIFSPDGRHLFTAAGPGVQVWVVANRTEAARFPELKESPHCFAVSPDGKTLATATWGNESSVRLWDVATGKPGAHLKGGKGGVQSIAFSPNGRLLAVAGYHRGVEIWEVASGQLRQTFTKHASQPSHALFTPDGKGVIVNARLAIHVWDLTTEKQLRLFATDRQISDGALALSPDGKLIAFSDLKGMIRVWDWRAAKEVRALTGGHQQSASRLVFAPDGKTLASTGFIENQLVLWDLETGKRRFDPGGHSSEVVSVAISPDGALVATGGSDRTVRLWDRATAKELRTISTGFNNPVGRVAFSPDGKLLAVTTMQGIRNNYAALFDVASGKELRRVGKDLPAQRGLAFSPDGKTLAMAGGGLVTFWEVETGKKVREAKGPAKAFSFWSIAYAPDGKRLAVALFNREVGLLDVEAGEQVEPLGEHRGSTLSVTFTPDGRHVVSGGADSTARLWNVATKAEVQRFGGHGSHVMGVAVSPDGKRLATACLDRLVRLWDLATGEELGAFAGHNAAAWDVAFSRDGKYLVSGSGDSTALVWEVRRMLAAGEEGVAKLSAKELDALWSELGETDAARAFKAMRALMQAPGQAFGLIRSRLAPVKMKAEVARLLAELDSDAFATREKALVALEKLGPAAAPDLRRALDRKLSDEVKGRLTRILERLGRQKASADEERERLRTLRCVELLETLGTPQARAALEALSRDDPESPVGREAKAALARLGKR